ncbi:hypothetical protein N9937_02410 [bacterium]|nr:hypothetical protein [bacterium]
MSRGAVEPTGIYIKMSDGSQMCFPFQENEEHYSASYSARYNPRTLNLKVIASILDSYSFLVLECTKKQAWKRIKDIRSALKARRK